VDLLLRWIISIPVFRCRCFICKFLIFNLIHLFDVVWRYHIDRIYYLAPSFDIVWLYAMIDGPGNGLSFNQNVFVQFYFLPFIILKFDVYGVLSVLTIAGYHHKVLSKLIFINNICHIFELPLAFNCVFLLFKAHVFNLGLCFTIMSRCQRLCIFLLIFNILYFFANLGLYVIAWPLVCTKHVSLVATNAAETFSYWLYWHSKLIELSRAEIYLSGILIN